jgi:KaiC/GvpD/RAD55 family RecA-like ATPase
MATEALKARFEPVRPTFQGITQSRRISSGVPGLDQLIQGGLLEKRVYTICGPPGSGKTTFSMQFLVQGGFEGKPGLYVAFHEAPENIYLDMCNYTFGLPNLVKRGYVQFLDMSGANPLAWLTEDDESPSPGNVLRVIQKIIEEQNIGRLVIDSLKAIKFSYSKPQVARRDMTRFMHGLKELGCTTVIISELEDPDRYEIEQHLSHGLIFLHNFFQSNKMVRSIQIMKMRGTKHDCDMRKIVFGPKGIQVDAKKVDRLS